MTRTKLIHTFSAPRSVPFAGLLAALLAVIALASAACGDGDFQSCPAGTQCVCEGDCQYECAGGGCEFECKESGITCEFRCPGGDCQASCEGARSCEMSCPDGDCNVDCNGTDCRITECTAGCQLDCDGANVCENSCTDPAQSCQTDPT